MPSGNLIWLTHLAPECTSTPPLALSTPDPAFTVAVCSEFYEELPTHSPVAIFLIQYSIPEWFARDGCDVARVATMIALKNRVYPPSFGAFHYSTQLGGAFALNIDWMVSCTATLVQRGRWACHCFVSPGHNPGPLECLAVALINRRFWLAVSTYPVLLFDTTTVISDGSKMSGGTPIQGGKWSFGSGRDLSFISDLATLKQVDPNPRKSEMGAAARVATSNGSMVVKEFFRPATPPNSVKAEIFGVTLALRIISGMPALREATILTDCQQAIIALTSEDAGRCADAADSFHRKLQSLKRELVIRLAWVPGHSGVVMNELADLDARDAALASRRHRIFENGSRNRVRTEQTMI
ncbi:hypothetical protein C8J57DRAFT_1210532 [Mycena rebaudengoi]|nr:hypothetical protein C8J57DRAFT_1210532 [Mycena rebaudengoi]